MLLPWIRWGKNGWLLNAAVYLPQFLWSRRYHPNNGTPSSPNNHEWPQPWSSVLVQQWHPSSLVLGHPENYSTLLDNNKFHSSNVHTILTGCRIQRYQFYHLFDWSGVDTPLCLPTCHQHDLLQTHQDVSINNTFPFSVDVNIANTSNISNT